jgi:prepilin-type N-terminal cleavage/methylation domain-containing protein
VKHRAFTLIELILVIAIISVVTAITLPNLVSSMRGNRLRAASRAVVMAGRYARSMAVLKQEEMAVVFDIDGRKITVASGGSPRPATMGSDDGMGDNQAQTGRWTNNVSKPHVAEVDTNAVSENDTGGGMPPIGGVTGGENATFMLDRVKIEYIDMKRGDKITKGKYSILYRSNGRCEPYTVRITDEYGASVTIDVDSLSSAKTGGS